MSCAQESLPATCSSTAAHGTATTTTPSSTRTGYVSMQRSLSLAGRSTQPSARLTFHACSGHTIDEPVMMPSQSGPLLCGQRLLVARRRSPRLKIAISRSPICTARPSRAGMFSTAVTRIHWLVIPSTPNSQPPTTNYQLPTTTGANCVGLRGVCPSCHASRARAFDLARRSRSPALTASVA